MVQKPLRSPDGPAPPARGPRPPPPGTTKARISKAARKGKGTDVLDEDFWVERNLPAPDKDGGCRSTEHQPKEQENQDLGGEGSDAEKECVADLAGSPCD